jgi:hypothetical protein
MTLKKLAVPPPPIEAPRREPGGTAGRWAIPAPGSQCSSSPPTRPKRVPKRTNPGISTLPQAPGRAGAISPDARLRHPAFRSIGFTSHQLGVGRCHLAGRSLQASCLPLDWLHLTPARGGPVPSRRTLAPGILPSARSMLASLSPSWLRLASTRRLDWHRPTPREPVVRGPAVFPRWPAPPPPCPTDTPRRFRPGRGRI